MTDTPNEVPKTVLVVEDDDAIRESFVELLETEGYRVVSVPNGQLGLDYLFQTAELPSLILLDLMMPVKDGIQFCSEKNNSLRLASIPVIIMSAHGQLDEKRFATKACAYLKKPVVDIDDVISLVRRYCPQAS